MHKSCSGLEFLADLSYQKASSLLVLNSLWVNISVNLMEIRDHRPSYLTPRNCDLNGLEWGLRVPELSQSLPPPPGSQG